MKRLQGALAILLLLAGAAHAADDIPTGALDEARTRAQVEALIKRFTDHKDKATLGMMQEAMDLSISFGAPAWNDGDHDACGTFYIKTAEAICKAFGDQASATPAAWAVIGDLKSAMERAKGLDDMDAKAWAMRYVFDKTAVSVSIEAARATEMVSLAQECLKRAEFAEAEDALNVAIAAGKELNGIKADNMPAACDIAPAAMVDALVAQKKYAPAAAMTAIAIERIPQLPQARRNIAAIYGDPAVYQKIMDQLNADAKAAPNDAAVQLMLGYEDYYAGLKATARQQFENVLKIDKENQAAKAFLKQIKPADTDGEQKSSHVDL